MKKIIEVENCEECPEVVPLLEGGLWCKLQHSRIENEEKIPRWCPLEDKEEK